HEKTFRLDIGDAARPAGQRHIFQAKKLVDAAVAVAEGGESIDIEAVHDSDLAGVDPASNVLGVLRVISEPGPRQDGLGRRRRRSGQSERKSEQEKSVPKARQQKV